MSPTDATYTIEGALTACGVTGTTLSGDEKKALDETGWILMPDVCDRDVLVRLRKALESAVAQDRSASGGGETGTRHVSDLIGREPGFEIAVTHPRVLARVPEGRSPAGRYFLRSTA